MLKRGINVGQTVPLTHLAALRETGQKGSNALPLTLLESCINVVTELYVAQDVSAEAGVSAMPTFQVQPVPCCTNSVTDILKVLCCASYLQGGTFSKKRVLDGRSGRMGRRWRSWLVRPRRSSRKWWKSMLALPWLRKSAWRCFLLSAVCGFRVCGFIRNAPNQSVHSVGKSSKAGHCGVPH